MAALLKSAESKDFVGSNPTLSASRIRSREAPMPTPPDLDPRVGLCAGCRHSRVVSSKRGSGFRLCERSADGSALPALSGAAGPALRRATSRRLADRAA